MAGQFSSSNSSVLRYNPTITLPYVCNKTLNLTACSTTTPPQSGDGFVADEWKIIARSIYIIIFIFGTVGNLLTCYIIISRKFMRRVIHIYTFNLAVSDLAVILLYIPVEMVRNENDLKWTMGASMCKISYIVTPTSLISSVCTLVAITLDRHRGVTKPFKWRGDSKKLLWYSIPAIWFIAITSCSPLFYYAKTVKGNGAYYCIEKWTSKVHERVYWITMFFVMVVVPLLIIIIANAHMIYVMKKLSSSVNHSDMEQHKQHRRMIRMVVALVLVYALCSSPQHIVFFWFQFGNLESQRDLSMHIFKAANLMVIVQSAINPVIYGTGRKDFKGAFKNIFRCLRVREWLSSSREETRVGAVSTLMVSVAKFKLPEPTANDDLNQFDGSLECHTRPLINKKIDLLRKKSEERSVTDTPPLKRPFTASLQVNNNRLQNGAFSRGQNLSLPIKLIPAKKVSFKSLEESTEDTSQSRVSFSAEIKLDKDELWKLTNSPESEV